MSNMPSLEAGLVIRILVFFVYVSSVQSIGLHTEINHVIELCVLFAHTLSDVERVHAGLCVAKWAQGRLT